MNLSVIILGTNNIFENETRCEIIFSNGENLKETIKNTKGKYITFINENDKVSKNYIDIILKKIETDFDYCYINYKINYNYTNEIKVLKNEDILKTRKPSFGKYIWNYIYKKETLLKFLKNNNSEVFKINECIPEIIYYHNPNNQSILTLFPLRDIKNTVHYKNIVYVGKYCNTIFNGYVTWIENIGKCFSNKFEITILYDEITKQTLEKFQKYFKCIKRNKFINYSCDRLFVTYSTFYYPSNIFPVEENYLFIHGNMADYPYTKKITDDLYTKYIAVSKECATKAIGYYNSDKIEYIYNPFKLNKSVKPHLKLISAQRSADVKKIDRIAKLASILDEEEIPYTWNLFTDKNEGINSNGLIYRHRTTDPYPYIEDSDYFVLLSDSEACPYSIIEALSLNTKVVVTPLPVTKELGLNETNSIIIPFEYFDDKEKIRQVVKKMYDEKEKQFKYNYDENYYKGYYQLFK